MKLAINGCTMSQHCPVECYSRGQPPAPYEIAALNQ